MSMLTALKMSSLTCKWIFYRPELNAKWGGPMELNFEGLELKQTNGQGEKSRRNKWGLLSTYHVYFQSYGL